MSQRTAPALRAATAAAACSAVLVAVTHSRARRRRAAPSAPGLDDWLDSYCVRERHERVIECPPAEALATALAMPVAPDWIVRALFRLRGFGAGAESIAEFTSSNGFLVIDRTPTTYVFGVAGRLWGERRLAGDRDAWASWAGPGVKIAADLRALALGPGRSLLVTETRVQALDPVSHVLFHLYWLVVGPFSGLIRRRWLRAVAARHHQPQSASGRVQLRDVVEADVETFFDHQREPEANRVAGFPPRDRDAHDAHWRKVMADGSIIAKTILFDGQVAGNIVGFTQDGRRLVGYWIGQAHWGRGVATQALALFTHQVAERPLHAEVAAHNLGSIRVLRRCGFVQTGARTGDEHDPVDELIFTLEASSAR